MQAPVKSRSPEPRLLLRTLLGESHHHNHREGRASAGSEQKSAEGHLVGKMDNECWVDTSHSAMLRNISQVSE